MATLVVPAAGQGSRLGGSGPKALVDLDGKPLIDWVVSAAAPSVDALVVVVQSWQREYFEEWAARADLPGHVSWAVQEAPAGSLDAVHVGLEHCRRRGLLGSGVVVIWSDQVGVGPNTVRIVAESVASGEKVLAVPLCETRQPYVWVELDESERINRVLRARDGDVSPDRGLADLGLFGLSEPLALRFLDLSREAAPGNEGRELDFTYALPALSSLSDRTFLPRVTDAAELLAVNTPDDLSRAREMLGRRRD